MGVQEASPLMSRQELIDEDIPHPHPTCCSIRLLCSSSLCCSGTIAKSGSAARRRSVPSDNLERKHLASFLYDLMEQRDRRPRTGCWKNRQKSKKAKGPSTNRLQ